MFTGETFWRESLNSRRFVKCFLLKKYLGDYFFGLIRFVSINKKKVRNSLSVMMSLQTLKLQHYEAYQSVLNKYYLAFLAFVKYNDIFDQVK